MSTTAVYRRLQHLAHRARIGALAPRDLRRTLAGDLLDAGADLAVVQQLLGHASPASTAGYDRRGARARRAAAGLVHIPYVRHPDTSDHHRPH